jgi:hypothetical protein
MTKETKDRPIRDIIDSLQLLIMSGKLKGQLARDIDKLCAAAATSRFYNEE